MARDKRIRGRLRRGWYSVLSLWEHDIKRKPEMRLAKIRRFAK